MLSNLQMEPNFDNTAGYLKFPGKFKLFVKGHQWTTWSHDTSSIPLYILDALHNSKALTNKENEITWMELIEENFRAGDTYVVDEIEKEGAEMLTTKFGETEIAFAVTGRDIKCAGHKLSMIGPPLHHGQYIGWIPRGLFREQVLDHYSVDGYGEPSTVLRVSNTGPGLRPEFYASQFRGRRLRVPRRPALVAATSAEPSGGGGAVPAAAAAAETSGGSEASSAATAAATTAPFPLIHPTLTSPFPQHPS
jgi:hypothetical protein